VEKDADPDHVGQMQAFGIADLGMGAELGYISIPELLENGAELDLYFKTLASHRRYYSPLPMRNCLGF
jgi:hypothetical protein